MKESVLWPILQQARTYALSNTEQDGNNFDVDKFEQKFAELIVRECIDIVKPTPDHEAWAQSYLGGVDGLELLEDKVNRIKFYFGVEE